MKGECVKRTEMELPARPDLLGVVRLAVAGAGHVMRFNLDELEDLKLIVAEACYQVCEGGVGKNSRLKVSTCLSDDTTHIVVSLTHEDASRKASEGLSQGLGLTLLRYLVDEINFRTNRGKTTLELTRGRSRSLN